MCMRVYTAIALLLLSMPLMAWDAAPRPRDTVAHTTTAICTRLTNTTVAIEQLLLQVKDKESADAAAPRLKKLQDRVSTLLGWLEHAPSDPGTGEEIARTFLTTTHITQRCIPVINTLIENQAYGSASLLEVLQNHGSDIPGQEQPPTSTQTPG